MSTPYQIQSLKFDLEIPSLSKNKAIQSQVVDVFNSQFTSMLNEVFNTYCNDEEIIIESIILELNPVALDLLKTDIVQQSREQLTAYFEKYKLKEKLNNDISSSQIETNSNNLHPILHYLFYGVNSWASKDLVTFEKSWGNHLKKNDFIEHIKTVSWKINAVKRLVYQLNEPLLNETIQKLVSSDASGIKIHHHLLMSIFSKKLFSVSSSINTIKQTLWINTFYYLLIKNQTSFSKTEYLNYHLTQLAAAYNLDFIELIKNLLIVSREEKRNNPLVVEYTNTIETIQKNADTKDVSEMVIQNDISIETIEKIVVKSNKSEEDIIFIRKWILVSNNRKVINQLWVQPLRENILEIVVGVLAPAATKFILRYHQEILSQYAIKPITTSKESLKRAIWLFTLDYLITSFSSTFQSKEYVISHARKISNHNGIDYAIFIRSLLLSVRSLSENDVKYHELLLVLKALSDDNLESDSNEKFSLNSFNTLNTNNIEPISNSVPTQEELKKAISSFILEYLKTSFSSPAQAKEFVLSQAKKISNRNEIDYVVFIQNLLVNVRSLSESDVKYRELLVTLKVISNDGLESESSKNILGDSVNAINTNNVEESLNEQVIKSIPTESFKRIISSFILDFLKTSFSSTAQAKEFVLSQAGKISKNKGIDYDILIQNLLLNVRQLSENDAKYHELLQILKALSGDRFESNSSDILTNTAIAMSNERVEELLNSSGRIEPHDNVRLKHWLLNRNNLITIQKKWIDNYNEPQLMLIIDILFPEQKSFIGKSILAISSLFEHCNLFESKSLNFKGFLYTQLIIYFQDNPNSFSKIAFVNLQVRSVLKHFDIKYRVFLAQYRAFLVAKENAQIKQLEYFSILNSLQNDLERKYKAHYNQQDINETNIKLVFEYLETGEIADNPNLLKTLGYKKWLGTIENLLIINPEKCFLLIATRDNSLQIHKSIVSDISTSLLRNILAFQSNYNKFLLLQKNLGTYTSISLKSIELSSIFYLEEGFFPNWVSKSMQHLIENKIYSKKVCSVLLLHSWSPHAIHNWTNNISTIQKKEALKQWTNNKNNHSLFCLYNNLSQVYKSMKSFEKHYSLIAFEKSFWIVFFKIFKLNTTISSLNFMAMFFKEWEHQFNVSFYNNNETMQILKSSLYLPLSIFETPKKVKYVEEKEKKEIEIENKSSSNEQYDDPLEKGMNESVVTLTKWYMENTGLIIAHPFLPQLFKYLDYLNDKNQFKNQETLWKSVYLLHYMATGELCNINEVDLTMSKILSGMLVEDPIPPDLVLSKNEIDYADEVLQVIISRWDKLGKTSSDGLRNTFLKRKGIVEEKDGAFQLTIETSGTDILLDYIPWNISIIKLPWIKNIIYASWR